MQLKGENSIKFYFTIVLLIFLLVLFLLINHYQPHLLDNRAVSNCSETQQVEQIAIKKGEAVDILERRGSEWVVSNKNNFPADSEIISTILQICNQARLIGLADNPTESSISDEIEVVFLTNKGEGTLEKIIILPGENNTEETRIKKLPDKRVYNVDSDLGRVFGVTEFRDLKIMEIDTSRVNRIEIRQSESILILKKDDTWHSISPLKISLDNGRMERILKRYSILQAQDVAELTTEALEKTSEKEVVIHYDHGEINFSLYRDVARNSHYLQVPQQSILFVISEDVYNLFPTNYQELLLL
jgi:hypothetical protein